MPIQFYYHQSSPPSKGVWMLMEEMGLDYEKHFIDLMVYENRKPEYLRINPMGQVPAIDIDGFMMWESRAIMLYLAAKYQKGSKAPNMYPEDPEKRAKIDMVLFADQSAYASKILPYIGIGEVLSGKGMPTGKLADLKVALGMYDTLLKENPYMAGEELSIADISCFNSLYMLSYTNYQGWDEFPNIKRWYENCIRKLKSFEVCIQQPTDVLKRAYVEALKLSQGLKFYYHPGSPPSRAVWMLLEELGVKYEPKVINLLENEHKTSEYKEINPLCQIPAIVDGDFKLWESRAMLRYLALKYGGESPETLYPTDPRQRAIVDMVLYSDGSAYEGKILPYLNIGGVLHGKGLAEDKLDGVKQALQMYDTYLTGKKYMVGDHLSIADLSCFNSLYILTLADFKGWKDYPNVEKWYENTIKMLKSYKTCIEDPEDVFKKMYQGALKGK